VVIRPLLRATADRLSCDDDLAIRERALLSDRVGIDILAGLLEPGYDKFPTGVRFVGHALSRSVQRNLSLSTPNLDGIHMNPATPKRCRAHQSGRRRASV
jgi:hypothetical protein